MTTSMGREIGDPACPDGVLQDVKGIMGDYLLLRVHKLSTTVKASKSIATMYRTTLITSILLHSCFWSVLAGKVLKRTT